MIRLLSLSDGKYIAIISASDYRRCNKYSWYVHFSKGNKCKTGQPYARSTINGKKVYLHRFIMDAPETMHVDHKNHCTLDCRRENLEIVTCCENMRRWRK